jgi:hypothetical protein
LDKITEPEELILLLKGIKGIIGQENTYFLLTVSEDALAKFSNRFGSERDLIESSFEEIYFLTKIGLNLSNKIITGKSDHYIKDNEYFEINGVLIWIFGNGIPREIKRILLDLYQDSLNVETSSPFDIWITLINNSINSLKMWALINNANDLEIYNFSICLRKLEQTLPESNFSYDEGSKWFNLLLNFFSKFYTIRFSKNDQNITLSNEILKDEINAFEKAMFEISLLCSSYILISKEGLDVGKAGLRMQSIFNLIPYSFLLAQNEFYDYLEELKIYSLSETEIVPPTI